MNTSELHSHSQKLCSFCDKPRDAVAFIIEKPGIVICNECVSRFSELLKDPNYGETTILYQECSFCSFMQSVELSPKPGTKPPDKGTRLIRGPLFCICDECLDVCNEFAAEYDAGK
jgi:ATP-dependent protease Clp ATPase subunit